MHGGHHGGDRRWLSLALALICAFMIGEVLVGLLSGSLALLSDAAHMVTDAAAIALALFAARMAERPPSGGFTFGLRRAEILSAQANGITLLILSAWIVYEAIMRLREPNDVAGAAVVITAVVGIGVNLVAAWLIGRANRRSLNVEGAFQHILTDLFAFIVTAIAGVVVLVSGFLEADTIASLFVAVLMIRSGFRLVRDSGRIFLEAAPSGIDPSALGGELAAMPGVVEVHDLHVWEVTSGYPAMSAHVLVTPGGDCHAVRRDIEGRLRETYAIDHTTLQVDHAELVQDDPHCADPHGAHYRA
jgi:cobalt-zinc-cadmium efflux system protein